MVNVVKTWQLVSELSMSCIWSSSIILIGIFHVVNSFWQSCPNRDPNDNRHKNLGYANANSMTTLLTQTTNLHFLQSYIQHIWQSYDSSQICDPNA